MQRVPAAAAALIASIAVLAGCTSAVNGTGQAGSAPAPGSSGTAGSSGARAGSSGAGSSAAASSAFPSDIQALGARLLKGTSALKSAHINLTENASGTIVNASGDEKLSGGRVLAMDLNETVNNLALRFILINSDVYAHLPPSVYQATKPWVQISSTTTDPQLQQLYTSFRQAEQTGTGDTVSIFVKAGKDLKYKGTQQTDGVTVGDYTLNVDVPSLPSDFPNKQTLIQSGLSSIPVEIFLDEQGRTRKFTEHIVVGGQTVDVQATMTKLDEPVTITAPPADQVEHA